MCEEKEDYSVSDEFTTKDGRIVVFRMPKWADLDGLLGFINSIIREGAPINLTTEVSRTEEIKFLARRLAEIEKGSIIQFIAEIDGEIVGNADIARNVGRQSHVGTLGIIVKSAFRRIGIGAKLIEKLTDEAKKKGLKIINLQVNETNIPAITLYKKLGFRETGRTPKAISWKGEYVDSVAMTVDIQ